MEPRLNVRLMKEET